ncbi:MAG TPA: SDR family NAD(P)-dependent oxidoreductase [Ramlibacter sp.]|nr:SDR family NAD(P)-dependent oxidoreductase [Ramlibacter sp.]
MQAHPPLALADLKVEGRLNGRRILVTGAASGIGRSVVEVFLRAGARVAALDRRRPAELPGEALCLEADVTDPDAVERAVAEAANAFGGIDGLVNAAGIANTDWADQVSLADWKRVLEVNLTGSFIVCRACLPHLRVTGRGAIVNFASGQGLAPFKQRSAYAASKAGVISLTRSLAMEWAPQVRVNTICPGAVDTPMVRGGYSPKALREQVGPRYALGRIGEPHEIALAALYLCSAESSFVTGIVLAVDGGRSYH